MQNTAITAKSKKTDQEYKKNKSSIKMNTNKLNLEFRIVFIILFLLNLLLSLSPIPYGGSVFSEQGIVTYFSALQLLSIFFLLLITSNYTHNKKLKNLFIIIGAGFLFLFADELLQLHEKTDLLIHSALRIQKTPLTDRIDDLIIAAYGIIGFMILYINRHVFWFSVNWRIRPFELEYKNGENHHAQTAKKLHGPRKGFHHQATPC